MVTREEHAVMCHMNMYTKNKDITKANIAIAKGRVAIANRKRQSFSDIKKKKMVFIDNNDKRIVIVQETGKEKYFAARDTKNGLQNQQHKIIICGYRR
jgi:sugar lactone lactonase YvrE